MTSVNANPSAMRALQSLNAASRDSAAARTRVASGLSVASPKDNAATWAIALKERSDLGGWRALQQSLSRTDSILDVARAGAETISDLLAEFKQRALALADPTTDTSARAFLLNDMKALSQQISDVANASTFDGVNLLTPKYDPIEVLVGHSGPPQPTLNVSVPMARGPGWVEAYFSWQNTAQSPRMTLNGATYTFTVGPLGTTTNYGLATQYGNYEDLSAIGAASLDYAFSAAAPAITPVPPYGVIIQGLTFQPLRTHETFQVDPTGSAGLDVYYQPLTAGWIGLSGFEYLPPEAIIDQVNHAIDRVSASAGYLGARQRIASDLQAQCGKMQDALTQGVGNLVDADLAREGARLEAARARERLAAEGLAVANAQPRMLLTLFG